MPEDVQFIQSMSDSFVSKVRLWKESGFKFRRRRHNDWTENYMMYRDKVQLNRLTQRQSVNIPLTKMIVKTLLKDIDDPPLMYFSSLDNDEQAEIYFNEKWKDDGKKNKNTIKDIVDKRQAILFGRTFKWLNIVNGRFYWEVTDPQDINVDRYIDPADFNTFHCLIREHIYKPLGSLAENPNYETSAIYDLQRSYMGTNGLLKAEQNQLDWIEKQARLASLGVIDAYFPVLGETFVELNEVLLKEFNKDTGREEIMFCVMADNMFPLMKAPLCDVIGETRDDFWKYNAPCVTWGDEVERTDFWSDGVSDAVRTLNKVMNAFFSQKVENRTLRNFGMNFFNSSLTDMGFTPQTFTPEAWGFYPMPVGESGKLADNLMHIEIPELTDNTEDLNYIQSVAEKVSGATSVQQGAEEPRAVTLGEIKVMLQNAKDRVRSMGVYYTDAWEEFGMKYAKMHEAQGDNIDPVTLHKKGRLTKKMYTKVIATSDYFKDGYFGFAIEAKMMREKQQEDEDSLQWLNGARSVMPGNQTLDTFFKEKLLQNAKMPAEMIVEAIKEDKHNQEMMAQQPNLAQPNAPSMAINYKDIGNNGTSGQSQMAKAAGIQIPSQQQQQSQTPLLPGPGGAQPPAAGPIMAHP